MCVLQAILSATARPQGNSDAGLSAATARGTTVVPIDEPDCQKGGDAATSADSNDSGNPAVQVLKVSCCFIVDIISEVVSGSRFEVFTASFGTPVYVGVRVSVHVCFCDCIGRVCGLLTCLQVGVAELAPTSVTEYAWRVKLAMKPPKDPVKFSENATVKSEVEVSAGPHQQCQGSVRVRDVIHSNAPATCRT